MTLAPGPATRLTVYLKANARWHHRPVPSEIVERAHRAGLAGASVFRGDEGFGKSAHLHTTRVLSLNGDLPCAVVIVDVDPDIADHLPCVYRP